MSFGVNSKKLLQSKNTYPSWTIRVRWWTGIKTGIDSRTSHLEMPRGVFFLAAPGAKSLSPLLTSTYDDWK